MCLRVRAPSLPVGWAVSAALRDAAQPAAGRGRSRWEVILLSAMQGPVVSLRSQYTGLIPLGYLCLLSANRMSLLFKVFIFHFSKRRAFQ